MGDGLKRATLAALCTRGPWTGCDNPTGLAGRGSPWTLTGDDLRAIYDTIARGADVPCRSDRKKDRAFQLLRKSGLIEYAGTPKRWRVVGGSS